MELFTYPTQLYNISSFIYVFVGNVILMCLYMYIPLFNKLRYVINTIICKVNDTYLHSRDYLWILMLTFYSIFFLNIQGLLGAPLVLANPFVCLTLSLFICGICILIGIYRQPIKFFTNLSPGGIPKVIAPFMVLIELMLLLLKPFMLAFRICLANAIGHMILHILENILKSPYTRVFLSLFLLIEIIKTILLCYLFTISIGILLKTCIEAH